MSKIQMTLEDTTDAMVASQLLAPMVLGLQALAVNGKQAHWNVRGENFVAIHQLFDTIVANAGVATEKMAMSLSVEEVDFLLAANVRGVFLTVTEGAKRLEAAGSREKQNGRIVIIGSITADKIVPATSVYGAT